MKKLFFLIFIIVSKVTFALTATDIANCKTNVKRSFSSVCQTTHNDPWGSGLSTAVNCNMGAAYTAIYNCDAGKYVVYQTAETRPDGTVKIHHKLHTNNYSKPDVITHIYQLSATPSTPQLIDCYAPKAPLDYNGHNLVNGMNPFTETAYSYWYYLQESPLCNGTNLAQWKYDVAESVSGGTRIVHVNLLKHSIGYSYPAGTAGVVPGYICRGNGLAGSGSNILGDYLYPSNDCPGTDVVVPNNAGLGAIRIKVLK